MSRAAVPLPSFEILAAALRRTTERLASELAEPLESEPEWNEIEWAVARSAAAMQGISTLLKNKLVWFGPPAWQAFLAEQHDQSVLRHERIGALLGDIDTALRARGVACVVLKGAALRALDLYGPGERPMGDVDLLVASADLEAVASVMTDIDFVEAGTTHRHRVYEPRHKAAPRGFGEHVDNPLKIEIHTAVAELLPVRSVDITERLSRGAARPGLNNYPDLVSLLLHLLLHAAGNMRSHALRQVQLHDIAVVANLLYESDWQTLLEGRWWLFPPLALTARYYPRQVPEDVLRAARAECPRVLRIAAARQSLTDVSWSNLRIHALPGIAWSRTPLDALRYMLSRVAPSRNSLAEIETARRNQPHLDRVPWYGLSQGSRIVRWAFGRPPRVQTLLSVRAALDSASVGATEAAD
jgi:putative nucleotidyltransferase-like protein